MKLETGRRAEAEAWLAMTLIVLEFPHLVNIPLLDLRPASYLLPGVPFAAEERPHGIDITPVIWPARRLGTPKCKYGVESFLSIGTVQQILFKNSLNYTYTHG